MNLIVIMLDSLRQDHVSFYNRGKPVFEGVEACKTPNIDRFAEDCVVFENAYPCGLPTIPVRTELMTGQYTLPYRPWRPLENEDITVAEILRREGYVCGLIADTYHLFRPAMNFHRGFHSFIWIRGQEYDAYMLPPPLKKKVEDYVNENYTDRWRELVARFLANTEDFEREEDWFPAKVVREAIKWLRRARKARYKRIFLWIDSFDPHEPWDPPPRFDSYTDPGYKGPRLILPMGGQASEWATPEEVRYIRGLYAGEVSFVDHWLGFLFRELEDLGYYDDSVIVLLADHGHPLADHGKFLKGTDRLYNELLKVPFMIRLPAGEGARRTDAIVQFPDLLPTILDLLGLSRETLSMHGRSFLPVLLGETDEHREYAISGYHEAVDRCIRDKKWSLIQRPEGQPDELYNLQEDPRETHNLIDECPEEAKRLAGVFGNYFRKVEQRIVKGVQGKYEVP
ncbi:sulfatase [Candidatus Bathyarchaeota archaeon]|nr:MAG: sulfatase [Candidatus Bathyarchaeota archaeon]